MLICIAAKSRIRFYIFFLLAIGLCFSSSIMFTNHLILYFSIVQYTLILVIYTHIGEKNLKNLPQMCKNAFQLQCKDNLRNMIFFTIESEMRYISIW